MALSGCSTPSPRRNRRATWLIVMVLAVLARGVNAGPPAADEMYSADYIRKHLVVGKTTTGAAEASFGKPDTIRHRSSGSGDEQTWLYRRAEPKGKEGFLTSVRRKAASAALLSGGKLSDAMSRVSGAASSTERTIDSANVLVGSEEKEATPAPARIRGIRIVFTAGVVSYLSYE